MAKDHLREQGRPRFSRQRPGGSSSIRSGRPSWASTTRCAARSSSRTSSGAATRPLASSAPSNLDRLKELGFRSATKAGISIGIADMIIPRRNRRQLEKAYREIAEVEKQYRRGIITDGERYNKVHRYLDAFTGEDSPT